MTATRVPTRDRMRSALDESASEERAAC